MQLHGIPLSASKVHAAPLFLSLQCQRDIIYIYLNIVKLYNKAVILLYKRMTVLPCGWNLRWSQMEHLHCWSSYPKTKWFMTLEQGLLESMLDWGAHEECHSETQFIFIFVIILWNNFRILCFNNKPKANTERIQAIQSDTAPDGLLTQLDNIVMIIFLDSAWKALGFSTYHLLIKNITTILLRELLLLF